MTIEGEVGDSGTFTDGSDDGVMYYDNVDVCSSNSITISVITVTPSTVLLVIVILLLYY